MLDATGPGFSKQALSWCSAVPQASSEAGHTKAESLTTVGNSQPQPMEATKHSLEQPLGQQLKQPIIQFAQNPHQLHGTNN